MKRLNIVAFDVPFPPSYGGAIDIYYKLKSFKEEGYKIYLHCFKYNKKCGESKNFLSLEDLCEKVYYYQRNVSRTLLFNTKPYIVVTRKSDELLKNLKSNKYPILFEGLHTTYEINNKLLRDRVKIVRAHNVEHNYYGNLAKVEKDIFRRYYFYNESSKLKRYEKILAHANGIAAISKSDFEYFDEKYKNVSLVSAFHADDKVKIKAGKGDYVLYHGSLDIGENNQAALYLVREVFNDLNIPLIIAGNKPSDELKLAIKNSKKNIKLKDNITTEQIYDLVSNAQINVLPTFQATGIKLKLLASLYKGRHCVANSFMVENTGLEALTSICNEPRQMKEIIKKLYNIPFTDEDIEKRQQFLNNSRFSNKKNIKELISLIVSSS